MKNFSKSEKFLLALQASTLRVPASLIFVLCFILTILATHYAYQNYRADQLARLERLNNSIVSSIEQRFEGYLSILVYTRSFFEVNPEIDETAFLGLVGNLRLEEKYPGLRRLGYAHKINTYDIPKFEARMNTKGISDFEVSSLNNNPHQIYSFPITHYYPMVKKTKYYGVDPYSEPVRRAAIDIAIKTGLATSTKTISFDSETNAEREGFAIYLPSYKKGLPLSTPEEREKAVRGLIMGTFDLERFFSFLTHLHPFNQNQLHFAVYDGTHETLASNSPGSLIFETSNQGQIQDTWFFEKIEKTTPIQFGNINWTVKFTTLPAFFAPGWWRLPFFVFCFGSIVTILMTLTVILSKNQSSMLLKDISLRKAAEAELQSEKKIVELISKIGLNLKAESDLRNIQLVIDTSTELTNAQFGAFFYSEVNEKGKSTTKYALSGISEDIFSEIPPQERFLELDYRPADCVVLRYKDITKEPRKNIPLPLSTPNSFIRIKSYLAVPVKSNKTGKLLGGLFYGHPDAGVFTEKDELIAESIAAQAAVAMDNAKLYSQLREAQEAAESANKAKSNFLANMSHEIRTPLGVILGYTDLAIEQHSQSPENLSEYLGFIKKSGEELTRIIGEVLDLAKIEANRLEIEKNKFNLHTFLNDILSFLNLRAREKGVILSLNQDLNTPQFIVSDPTRLRQILTNLVGNAIKFTEKGSITLHVKPVRITSDEIKLSFAIEDTGIGISDDQKQKLFKPFSQADSSITRKYGGTGLGLLLSKQLANAMGGDLKLVYSAPGKGSWFEFDITAYPAAEETQSLQNWPTSKTEDNNSLEGKKILIVEDSEDNQVLLKYYLKNIKADIQLAKNGLEGIDVTQNFNPDLVLMDIQMPVMDGYTATKELRDSGFKNPIIALTAHALNEDRERALNNGFNDYLTKPIDRKLLMEALNKYLS